jgi:ABC-type multidrug transport system ATPase subunit
VVVILSTHIVEDVRELCSRMAIISNGELILEGIPAQTIDALKGKIWSKVVSTEAEREAIEKGFQVISAHMLGGLNELRIYSETSPGDGFGRAEADLEDVYFFNLTRHQRN